MSAFTYPKLCDFDISRVLGKGGFGEVVLCRYKGKFVVALKKLKMKSASVESKSLIQREIEIHSSLGRHENVLEFYGHFQVGHETCLILEYALGGSLCKKLFYADKFDEKTSALYIKDISQAIHYCHSHNVIHRDIKPDNMLLGNEEKVKIADFGLATTSMSCTTYCGTLDYMAPEMVARQGGHKQCVSYNKQVDTWALGVVLYEFLVGSPPFGTISDDPKVIVQRISQVDFRWPSGVTDDAKDLISKLLKKDPRQRLPLECIPTHPFVLRNLRG